MDIEEIKRQIKHGRAYLDAQPGGEQAHQFISLRVPQVLDVLKLIEEVERLEHIEQAAREMREYITLRDVCTVDGSVGDALEKIQRWDNALAGVGTPTGEG